MLLALPLMWGRGGFRSATGTNSVELLPQLTQSVLSMPHEKGPRVTSLCHNYDVNVVQAFKWVLDRHTKIEYQCGYVSHNKVTE